MRCGREQRSRRDGAVRRAAALTSARSRRDTPLQSALLLSCQHCAKGLQLLMDHILGLQNHSERGCDDPASWFGIAPRTCRFSVYNSIGSPGLSRHPVR